MIELVLDNTNDYSVEVEPGASISQPEFGHFNYIIGTGVEFALGTSDVAVFPGYTQIGNSEGDGGMGRPRNLVNDATALTILVTGSGNKYDALLTFFYSDGPGDVGTPPAPYNNPGAVFQLTAAESGPAVPEPSSIALLLMGGVGLVGYGWRKRRQA